jgi:hypothetical protein
MPSKELLLKGLDADNHEIESLGTPTAAKSATYTELTMPASDVADTAHPGTSFVAAAADHVHEGVHGVAVNGGSVALGDINLVDGDGIAISRTGNDISFSAGAGSLNKVTLGHDGAAYSVGVGEEIIREWLVNFDDCGASSIKAMLAAIVKVSTGIGTYNLRIGATAPGAVTGSTVHATFTHNAATEAMKENLGTAFANPGGRQLVQVTANGDTAGSKNQIRGIHLSLG